MKKGDALFLIVVLSAVGIAVSGYLLRMHYHPELESYCTINSFLDCGEVNQSEYAEILGIPVALVGLVGYIAILILALLRMFGFTKILGLEVTSVLFLAIIVGAVFSTYLTFIEFIVIQKVCIFCLTAWIVILLVLDLSRRVFFAEREERSLEEGAAEV